MWHSKKVVLVTLLTGVLLVGTTGMVGCAQTGSESLQGAPEDQSQMTEDEGDGFGAPPHDRGPLGNQMAGVAEILGIDQQTLADAFAQARSEMQDVGAGGGQPEALMARVAEILGIDQQKLEDAFSQAGPGIMGGDSQQRPFHREPGSR